MERQWYLSRDGQVFGPIPDAQMLQSAAQGQVLPTDLVAVMGDQTWWPATSIPNLLPAPAEVEVEVEVIAPVQPAAEANPFANLESAEEFQTRMQKRVADAYTGTSGQDPIPGVAAGVVAGLFGG
jgi:hypothetical protein